MLYPLLVSLALLSNAQEECIYTANEGSYMLNLSSISSWTFEYQGEDHWYYYTPCRNGLSCTQGNAAFNANTAQFIPGQNQCSSYLSVDHYERPRYSFIGGSWYFAYSDGELCDSTQQPRKTSVFYTCNNVNNISPGHLQTAYEVSPGSCDYVFTIASTLACVPQNKYNAKCQFRASDGQGGYNYLDLSKFQGDVVHQDLKNGYDFYYSICSNSLPCYQQQNRQTMSVVRNQATQTCELTLGVWEEGQVQPLFHSEDSGIHWTFHYWNGDMCANGQKAEQKIRYFCDESVDTYKVMGVYGEGNCVFDMNISTKAACKTREPQYVDAKMLFDKD